MAILSENMVFSKTRTQDLRNVRQLNAWGSELTDVSIVRQMPHVQVLSLSVNNITSLVDFGGCKNLQELYLRENKIRDLNELLHLQELQHLKKLWLAGNPCAEQPNYRMTVLRALPRLETLDNIHVTPEEVSQAECSGNDLSESGNGGPQSPEVRRDASPEFVGQDDEDEEDAYEEQPTQSEFARQQQQHQNLVQHSPVVPNARDSPNKAMSPTGSQANHLNSQQQSAQPSQNNSHGNQRHSQQRMSYPNESSWGPSGPVTPQTRPPPPHLQGIPMQTPSIVRSASINDYAMFNGNGAALLNAHNPHLPVSESVNSSYQYDQPNGGGGQSNGTSANKRESYQGRMLPKGGKNRVSETLTCALESNQRKLDAKVFY